MILKRLHREEYYLKGTVGEPREYLARVGFNLLGGSGTKKNGPVQTSTPNLCYNLRVGLGDNSITIIIAI